MTSNKLFVLFHRRNQYLENQTQYYKNKLGARERQETGDAKWLNFIMDRKQIAEFAAST